MTWLEEIDWRRGVAWLGLAAGPMVALAAVALLWWMSTGPTALARVPDLTGLRADAADALAGQSGLATKPVRVVRGGQAGTVIGQSPEPGAFLRRGRQITVAVTLGARQVVVPQVVGMPVDQARGVIAQAGLSVSAVIYRQYPEAEPGRVVSTLPAAGARADQGSGVELDVPLPPH
jgi:serine/threonine-protein kinase